jgi:hypothetical protein
MTLLVHQTAVDHGADFIDGIGELQTAVLDMHARFAVRQVTSVDVGNAAARNGARVNRTPAHLQGQIAWAAPPMSSAA